MQQTIGWALLRALPQPASATRIALTLFTTLFAFGGFLMMYTYVGLVLE